MKIDIVHMKIDDVKVGSIFKYEAAIWIKTNASHEQSGYECVGLERGNLSFLDKGTQVLEVVAELRVFT